MPHSDWQGAMVTKLGDESDLELPFFDVTPGLSSLLPAPAGGAELRCHARRRLLPGVRIAFNSGPDLEKDADTDAHRANLISITPMNGDMTAGNKAADDLSEILAALLP